MQSLFSLSDAYDMIGHSHVIRSGISSDLPSHDISVKGSRYDFNQTAFLNVQKNVGLAINRCNQQHLMSYTRM